MEKAVFSHTLGTLGSGGGQGAARFSRPLPLIPLCTVSLSNTNAAITLGNFSIYLSVPFNSLPPGLFTSSVPLILSSPNSYGGAMAFVRLPVL